MTTERSRALWGLMIAALFTCMPAYAAPGADIAFAGSDDAPILTLTREHGMVRGLEDRPLVRVYANGLVHVHVPPYMKGAGHYRYRLETAELDRLLRGLDDDGVMRFDAQAVRAERSAAEAARHAASGERFVTLDSTKTRIELDFASFGRAGETPAALKNVIEWADVGIEALRYPQVHGLTGLAAAEASLLALMDDPRRRSVKAPEGE